MKIKKKGHISQRGEKSFRFKYETGADPVTGKRVTKYLTVKGTKKDAQAKLNEILHNLDVGAYVDPSKKTVAPRAS